jgi:hypothetical protein
MHYKIEWGMLNPRLSCCKHYKLLETYGSCMKKTLSYLQAYYLLQEEGFRSRNLKKHQRPKMSNRLHCIKIYHLRVEMRTRKLCLLQSCRRNINQNMLGSSSLLSDHSKCLTEVYLFKQCCWLKQLLQFYISYFCQYQIFLLVFQFSEQTFGSLLDLNHLEDILLLFFQSLMSSCKLLLKLYLIFQLYKRSW